MSTSPALRQTPPARALAGTHGVSCSHVSTVARAFCPVQTPPARTVSTHAALTRKGF